MISVIITCYNYGKYLSDAVESVIRQTYQNFEIIIVNDGSVDNTKAVAEEIINRYSEQKITLINQKNQGVSAARNAGIMQSAGEYILCLDADDILVETMLEETYTTLEKNSDFAIAYTDRQDFGAISQIVEATEYDFQKLKYFNQLSYCALYRKIVWENVGGYRTNIKNAPDWDFWIAAGALGYKGIRIPKPLLKYRRHSDGLFRQTQQNFVKVRAQIILNNREVYPPQYIILAKKILHNYEQIPNYTPPVVSVIIPTLNRPQKLAKAIDSLLYQTYQNFEIIVVNDGCIDIQNIIDERNKDGRILYIINEATHGVASARNTGLAWASGKYICYLDDDDVYYPNHLEVLLNFLENNQFDIAYTDAYRGVYSKSNDQQTLIKKEKIYSQDFDNRKILISNFIPITCLMHRRICLDEIGMFDTNLPIHEDWDFLIRLSQKFNIYHINKVTCEFTRTIEEKSLMQNYYNEFTKSLETIYKKYNYLAKKDESIQREQNLIISNLKLYQSQTLSLKNLLLFFKHGFWQEEVGWYWMSEEGLIEVLVADEALTTLFFEISCSKAEYYKIFPFHIYIFVNDEFYKKEKFETDNQSIKIGIVLKPSVCNYRIRLTCTESFVPQIIKNIDDSRVLSVRLGNFIALGSNLMSKLKGENFLKQISESGEGLGSLLEIYLAIAEHLKPLRTYEIYENLKKEKDNLQKSANAFLVDRERLQNNYKLLEEDRDKWKVNYKLLEEDRDKWKVNYKLLEEDRDKWKVNYKLLEEDRNKWKEHSLAGGREKKRFSLLKLIHSFIKNIRIRIFS